MSFFIPPIKGRLNGRVNGRVNKGELSERDTTIYKVVKAYPGLRTPKLLEIVKEIDPSINENILYKRLRALSDIIEFVGPSKTGGYYIKGDL